MPHRLTVAVGGLILIALLAGCDSALFNGYDGPVGRRTCLVQEANMVRVDTTGFSAAQVADIRSAIDWLRGRTGVQLLYVASPGENWRPSETSGVLIERNRVIDDSGYTRRAFSKPSDRNGDGWYDAGILWIDPYADGLATSRRWGPGGANFFKLIVHELSHQLGVADVNDSTELMGSIAVDEPGWGDGVSWDAVGC